MICYYVRKHHYLLNGNLRELDSIESKYVRNNVVKSLIVLSKFLNRHEEFKNRLKAYDIKLYTQDSFASFLRIFNNHSSDLLDGTDRLQLYLETMKSYSSSMLYSLVCVGLKLSHHST